MLKVERESKESRPLKGKRNAQRGKPTGVRSLPPKGIKKREGSPPSKGRTKTEP